MLTLKVITEEKERVIKGLEKKNFPNAANAIEEVIETDKKRREAQTELDKNLSEAKKMAAQTLSLAPGDRIVITGGNTTGRSGNTNLIKIEEI